MELSSISYNSTAIPLSSIYSDASQCLSLSVPLFWTRCKKKKKNIYPSTYFLFPHLCHFVFFHSFLHIPMAWMWRWNPIYSTIYLTLPRSSSAPPTPFSPAPCHSLHLHSLTPHFCLPHPPSESQVIYLSSCASINPPISQSSLGVPWKGCTSGCTARRESE